MRNITILVLLCGQSAIAQPESYDLGDTNYTQGSGTSYVPFSGDIEWGALGKINWQPFAGNSLWRQADANDSWPNFLIDPSTGNKPDMQPHGDVLAYTMGGVGDVDGDGYGDFAVTWYDAEKRIEPTSVQPAQGGPPGYFSSLSSDADQVGYVRIISGNPTSAGWGHGPPPWASQFDSDTYNNGSGTPNTMLRRIGPDFWGKTHGGLWSHEITSIGDLDGDGRSEVILSANSARTGGGFLEIWAWTDQYYPHNAVNPGTIRWVKILEITGTDDLTDPPKPSLNSRTRMDEFGYNAYSGPIPDANSPVGFDLDFNEDGQPDLIMATRFYRDDQYGHFVYRNGSNGRNTAPGVVQVFLMPTKEVFQEIRDFALQTCDIQSNWTGESGADDITDYLPLRMTSDDYTIKIAGDQILRANDDTGPASGYPRWFGNEIDPAGDLDGDGVMDLAVAAPYHVDQDRYVDNTYFDDYEGQVYLFLSSSIRDDAASRRWDWNNKPKYYIPSPPPPFVEVREECGPKKFSYIIKKNNFSAPGQQINMVSSDADYVLIGDRISNNVGSFALGSSLEAGVDMDGDSDPDLVIGNSRTGQAFVFLDIQSQILADITSAGGSPLWNTQSSPRVLWRYDNSVSNIIESDIIIRSGVALAGQVGNHFNLRDTGTNYARLTGVTIAGDQNGDGNCELFISCTGAATNKVLLVVNIPDDPTTVSDSDVVAEVWPEDINYNYISNTTFNSIHAQHANLKGWALWNTSGQDDMLVGARGFPRLIETFPSGGVEYNVGSFDQSSTSDTKWLAVPAGKSYLLRSR